MHKSRDSTQMRELRSEKKLGDVVPNIARMLKKNSEAFADHIAYQEAKDGSYHGIRWTDLYDNILNIAFNLRKYGFNKGDKMVLFSRNRLEMLQMELAIMASGGVSVPIFAGFKRETATLLIDHSDARFLAVEGEVQLSNLDPDQELEQIFSFEDPEDNSFSNVTAFKALLKKRTDPYFQLDLDADPKEICLNMYTSGTMGIPKCVQLSHLNILSQQAALSVLWDIDENDRFLSYLPWHHSFGGIFEKFCALYHGAILSLESGYGKNAELIMKNWGLVKPTVFFSIPKVYKELLELSQKDKRSEDLFFNSGLKFIFTAAASLPKKLSDEFESRNIHVIEGWGLTETAPCCTLTDPTVKRKTGVVGKPIPGVTIRLADDGEILINGPNVMKCYYKNDEANKDLFTKDGWFKTGDVGELTETGLKLVSRKDRIFKLLNGEKVVPTDFEKIIEHKCQYLSFAIVYGTGKEFPVALLFPNRNLLNDPDPQKATEGTCKYPKSFNDLGNCLHGCLNDANCDIMQKFAKVKAALLIDDELSIEGGTLTPSMKVAPNKVIEAYRLDLENLYDSGSSIDEDTFLIKLDQQETTNKVQ